MKKILLIVCGLFLLTGCQKENKVDVIKEFTSKIEKAKSYKITSTMQLNNDEETFNYEVNVTYLKDNYYKVEMINSANNHEQIILRTDDELYVITPSLNKSFKFESNWPDNSSQAYILSAIVKDVKNDKNVEIVDKNVIKAKVDYPNNEELSYEKIYLDDNYNIKKVEVYSDADIKKITVEFTNIDLDASVDKDEFSLENYKINNSCDEQSDKCEENVMGQIESAIYPLYMPTNTYLSSSDLVKNDEGQRIILTFSGDKNFVIVEENANVNIEHEIVPVYGEPIMINDTIAALSSSSIYWTSNNIDYYLVSDDLSVSEMVFIASSLGNYTATIATK